MTVMLHTASLMTVINLITVKNFAALFNCTPAGRASYLMKAPAKTLLNNWLGLDALTRSSTVGWLLLQRFSVGLAVEYSPCFGCVES